LKKWTVNHSSATIKSVKGSVLVFNLSKTSLFVIKKMKTNQVIFCLIHVLIFLSDESLSQSISLKKCCPLDQILDKSGLSCRPKPIGIVLSNVTLLPEKLFNVESMENDASHDISDQNFSIGMITCEKSNQKVLTIGQDFTVTNKGKLLSVNNGTYDSSLDLGDFCLDFSIDETGRAYNVAVMCDPCNVDARFCVTSCCPHSKLYASEGCVDSGLKWIPETGSYINLKSNLSQNVFYHFYSNI